jgi:hypothetical protein
MPSALDQAFSITNLRLAWLRTRTSNEAWIKSYFRHIYRAYSLTEDDNLNDLRGRLVNDLYQPIHPAKLHRPKPSGIQRTITLLHIEDQIVYQALVNIIANQLLPQVSRYHYSSIFGHIYAGKASPYFYRSWKVGYRKFTNAMRQAFDDGYKYTASFDLTACYDSIDHSVLTHFLLALKLEPEFCQRLCRYLRHWTTNSSSGEPIYHGHGIPQGPLPSGLLAETVLRGFDRSNSKSGRFRYFRYVDDIRLFSKSEKGLREELIDLDLRSKKIGLFPQTSKIGIHKIHDIDDELKSISNPIEYVTLTPEPDQEKVRKRLVELSPSCRVKNETRFKYVLGRATPNARISLRLLNILESQPHLFAAISNHLLKAAKLPMSTSQHCMKLIEESNLYPAFTAALINVLRGRIHPSLERRLEELCKKILSRGRYNNNPELRAAIVSTLLHYRSITWKQVRFNVNWQEEWWVRATLIRNVDQDFWGEPNYEQLLNILLRDEVVDVSIVAAELIIAQGVIVRGPMREIHKVAQFVLRRAGLIGRVQSGRCLVSEIMINTLGSSLNVINWRRLLGRQRYKKFLVKIARWNGYGITDATAWVNLTDVINDMILDILFKHDTAIGSYTLGKIGSSLSYPSRFSTKYPTLWDAVKEIHDKRLVSDLSHSVTKSTGKATKRIEFRDIRQIKMKLAAGYLELWNKW